MLEAALPTLQTLRNPVADRLAAVERMMASIAATDFGHVNEVGDYLLTSRGKLLRPTLLLLSNEVGDRPSDDAILLGAVVELLHMATLVHDDAVDHSPRRRGMPTVNSRWSHQVAVIMGDYLYSRAMVELARSGNLEAIRLLSVAANRMTIGEMRQLAMHDTLGFSERDYELLCEDKTAGLISAACELGALLGDPEHRSALGAFGRELGMAFQITDDLLDYAAPAAGTGKPRGLDLREHKVTLPLIAALPELTVQERREVTALFADPEPPATAVESVMAAIERAGGLDYAHRRGREYAERARSYLADLPDEPCVRRLELMVDYVVERER